MNNFKKIFIQSLINNNRLSFSVFLVGSNHLWNNSFSGGGTCINSDGTSTNTYQIELPVTAPFSLLITNHFLFPVVLR
jgi:hypothetical protein